MRNVSLCYTPVRRYLPGSQFSFPVFRQALNCCYYRLSEQDKQMLWVSVARGRATISVDDLPVAAVGGAESVVGGAATPRGAILRGGGGATRGTPRGESTRPTTAPSPVRPSEEKVRPRSAGVSSKGGISLTPRTPPRTPASPSASAGASMSTQTAGAAAANQTVVAKKRGGSSQTAQKGTTPRRMSAGQKTTAAVGRKVLPAQQGGRGSSLEGGGSCTKAVSPPTRNGNAGAGAPSSARGTPRRERDFSAKSARQRPATSSGGGDRTSAAGVVPSSTSFSRCPPVGSTKTCSSAAPPVGLTPLPLGRTAGRTAPRENYSTAAASATAPANDPQPFLPSSSTTKALAPQHDDLAPRATRTPTERTRTTPPGQTRTMTPQERSREQLKQSSLRELCHRFAELSGDPTSDHYLWTPRAFFSSTDQFDQPLSFELLSQQIGFAIRKFNPVLLQFSTLEDLCCAVEALWPEYKPTGGGSTSFFEEDFEEEDLAEAGILVPVDRDGERTGERALGNNVEGGADCDGQTGDRGPPGSCTDHKALVGLAGGVRGTAAHLGGGEQTAAGARSLPTSRPQSAGGPRPQSAGGPRPQSAGRPGSGRPGSASRAVRCFDARHDDPLTLFPPVDAGFLSQDDTARKLYAELHSSYDEDDFEPENTCSVPEDGTVPDRPEDGTVPITTTNFDGFVLGEGLMDPFPALPVPEIAPVSANPSAPETPCWASPAVPVLESGAAGASSQLREEDDYQDDEFEQEESASDERAPSDITFASPPQMHQQTAPSSTEEFCATFAGGYSAGALERGEPSGGNNQFVGYSALERASMLLDQAVSNEELSSSTQSAAKNSTSQSAAKNSAATAAPALVSGSTVVSTLLDISSEDSSSSSSSASVGKPRTRTTRSLHCKGGPRSVPPTEAGEQITQKTANQEGGELVANQSAFPRKNAEVGSSSRTITAMNQEGQQSAFPRNAEVGSSSRTIEDVEEAVGSEAAIVALGALSAPRVAIDVFGRGEEETQSTSCEK